MAKKALGQHWLRDQTSLEAMCTAADVNDQDTVLEVGPGLGTLTKLLAQKAQQVIAVELDHTLAEDLPGRVLATNVQVVEQDILQFNLTNLPRGYKVVANIPYYLTSHLLRVLSESSNAPSQAALLVQKEVAERVAAHPGNMSLLSVSAQFHWQVSVGSIVPAKLFSPPPKVDSQILILKKRSNDVLFPDVDIKIFFQIVKAGFSNRRKTLLNSLSGGLAKSKAEVAQLLTKANIDPTQRAQNLSLDDWHRVYTQLRINT